jgi:hypothetical protein
MSNAADIGIISPVTLPFAGTPANSQGQVDLGSLPVVQEPVDPAPAGTAFVYKMRGRDDGVAAPGFVTWTASFPDFLGVNSGSSVPPIVGSLIPGSVVEVSRWPL